MGRKQKQTEPRVVVAVRIRRVAKDRLEAVAKARGESLSDFLRPTLERAAARKAA